MFGLFGKGDKTENKDVRKSQDEMRVSGDEIPEEVLRGFVGGYEPGDAREGISEENADQDYAAGQMNDVDGWD